MVTITDDNLQFDDSYLLAFHEDHEVIPQSDEKHALELQLQEVILMSAAIKSETPKRKGKEIGNPQTCCGNESGRLCFVCMDFKPIWEMFIGNTCTHLFCNDCVAKHVAAKLQDNIIHVRCPDLTCNVALEPLFCRSVVPAEVFDRWEAALSESVILVFEKLYCPFEDCSAILVNNGGTDYQNVVESECPACHRLFCSQCKVAWHAGVLCTEFRNRTRTKDQGKISW